MLLRRLAVAVVAVAILGGESVSPVQAQPAQDHDVSPACSNGYVSISFDDGPTPSTPRLLAALRRYKVTATFFDVGRQAKLFPKYVTAEREAGHAIANHSYNHPNFQMVGDDAALAQLARAQKTLTVGTTKPKFYRPPYGATDAAIAQRAKDTLGLTEIIWTVDTKDWDGRRSTDIVNTVATAKNGDFVLMHDGHPNTIHAIGKIARGLSRRGLCAGRIIAGATPHEVWPGFAFNADVTAWPTPTRRHRH